MVHQLVALSAAAASIFGAANAHVAPRHHGHFVEIVERQNPYPTGPQYDYPPLPSITALDPEYDQNTLPVPTNFPAGSQPPIPNAPKIPDYSINPADWPQDWSKPPDTNSDLVKEWLKELDGKNIPAFKPNPTVDCQDPQNAEALSQAGTGGRCWWTCGGCLRDADITTCPKQWDYGLTFDDGPGLYTNKLLTYLDSQSLKATFFVVGPRVISRPEIVVYEHMTGHEIAVHGWSHTALTTLTTEQVVSELGWTRKAVKDVTGITPRMMRPPYGDIDDRVRAIAMAMGMVPVIWTSLDDGNGGKITWDSQDWRVHAGTVQAEPNQKAFEEILDRGANLSTGVVALQHDIYDESVNLAIGYTLPYLKNHNPRINAQPVNICQGRPLGDAYVETNTGAGTPNSPSGSGVSPTGSNTSTASGTKTGSGTATSTPSSNSNGVVRTSISASLACLVTFGGVVLGAFLL